MLVERDEQLARADSILTDSASGSGRIVLLEGPTSSGRTELLRMFGERAGTVGYHVLSATGSRDERALPYGVVSQIVRAAGLPQRFLDRTANLLATGADAAFSDGVDADPAASSEQMRVCHLLSLALLDLAEDAPVFIGVDDARHSDVASLQCLRYLIRRLGSARMVMVMTDNMDQREVHITFCGELLRLPHFRRVRVEPLSAVGVDELITEHLGARKARELGPEFFAISGGCPLLLHALIDDHAVAGKVRQQGYGLALLSCLHRGDPLRLRLARGIAVLDGDGGGDGEGDDGGRDGDSDIGREELAELVGADMTSVEQSLTAMNDAGLLAGDQFRHPVARAAVLDDLPEESRTDLNRRAADLLHSRGMSASSIARHLVSANRAGVAWAPSVLHEAAEQALLDHDLERAVDCLELAHRSSVDERDRASTRARLAHVESKINPSSAARHLPPLVAAAHRDQLRHNDSLALVRQLAWHGRTDEAAGLLDHMRTAPSTGIGCADLRDIELWLSCAHPSLARRRQDPGQKLLQVAPGADPWLRSTAALADLLTSGKTVEAVTRAEQVLRSLHLSRTSPWAEESAMLALLVLVYTDKLELATEWCERLLAESRDQRCPTALALFSSVRAEIAVRTGHLADAVRLAGDALTHLQPKAWGAAIGFPLGSLILAASRMGDFETGARHLTQAVPEAMNESRSGLHYMYARGHYYLGTKHYHAALANFRSCGELMRGWGLDVAGLVPWRTNAAEAWIHLGNVDQARLLISDQLARPGVDGPRARGAALRLLATISPPGKRLQLLTEALDLFESCGDRFEQARVLADFSRAYNALDQKRRARLLFRQAVHVANMCEAKPLYQELLQVSGDTDAAAATGESDRINLLTSSERRVASLAVMGYTNREIATKLYITPSTVEQHLTRIFRKLEVKGRAELPVGLWAELTKAG